MAKKGVRQHSPDCEGRFPELRGLFYDAAVQWKHQKGGLLARVVTDRDLREVIAVAESMTQLPFNKFDTTHPYDPYFSSTVDPLRPDPWSRNNLTLALVPFVFEGMRETLYASTVRANTFLTALENAAHGNFHRSIDDALESNESLEGSFSPAEFTELLQAEALKFLYGEGARTRFGQEQTILLKEVSGRDYTITGNSVNTSIIDAYARLYARNSELLDNLRLFFSGTYSLDKDLRLKMKDFMVPTTDGRGVVSLSGYYIDAQFGPGQSVQRNIVSSAPYKMILFRGIPPDHEHYQPGGLPVFGISFFITQYQSRDTMLIAQIQDIRGERVPETTTPGLCALTLAEKLGARMGFKAIACYSSNSFGNPPHIKYAHPLRYHYPDDASLAQVIHLNYDEPAEALHWDKIRDPWIRKNGPIMGYIRKL